MPAGGGEGRGKAAAVRGWQPKPHPRSAGKVDMSLYGRPRRRQPFWEEAPATAGKSEPAADEVLVLGASELARIKAHSFLPSEAEMQRHRELAEQLEQERKATAEARKARMRARAEENMPHTDQGIEQRLADEAARALLKDRRFEEQDAVKRLRALAAQAEAFTLRDRQVLEQAERRRAEKEYESRMDHIMEAARSLSTRRCEEEEEGRLQRQQETRELLARQIKARERQRLLEEEAREQEGQAMRALVEKYKQEEKKQQLQKAEQAKRLRQEVLGAHARALEARRENKEREREEVQAILAYQQQKDVELAAQEAEETARAAARKARQAALLAQQERATNDTEDMEATRARRAAAQRERQERLREQEAALKHRQTVLALKEELLRQADANNARKAAEAEEAREEHAQWLARAETLRAREESEASRRQRMNRELLQALQAQVADTDARRRHKRLADAEEGERLRRLALAEEAEVEAARRQLLAALEAKGVDSKYLVELRKPTSLSQAPLDGDVGRVTTTSSSSGSSSRKNASMAGSSGGKGRDQATTAAKAF